MSDVVLSCEQRNNIAKYVGYLINDLMLKDDAGVVRVISWLNEEVVDFES